MISTIGQPQVKPAKGIILIVENRAETRDGLVELLSSYGYQAIPIDDYTDFNIDAVVSEAQGYRPHVCLVDIRLNGPAEWDGDRKNDLSGIELCQQLRDANCIVRSAYFTSPAMRRAYEDAKVRFTVGSADPVPELLAKIETAAREKSAAASSVQVDWTEIDFGSELKFLEDSAEIKRQLADDMVLQLLVAYNANCKTVRIESISNPHVTTGSAARGKSLVVKAYLDDDPIPLVIKLSQADKMRFESDNFQTHLRNRLGPYFPGQNAFVTFWDLGGAIYPYVTNAQSDSPTYHEFFTCTDDLDTLWSPLDQLFNEVWHPLYVHQVQPTQHETLYEHYNTKLDLSNKIAQHDLHRHMTAASKRLLARLNLPNPLEWLETHHRQSPGRFTQCITHGDLHADNILVNLGNTFIIDFERTGYGHVLRDFAELEVDILTRLLHMDDLDMYGRFINWLIDGIHVNRAAGYQVEANDTLAQRKVAHLITKLRQTAAKLTNITRESEYLWPILFDALFVAAISDSQRERSLLLAASACKRLETIIGTYA